MRDLDKLNFPAVRVWN